MDPEMPWLERSPNFPAEASCMLIVHMTRWKDRTGLLFGGTNIIYYAEMSICLLMMLSLIIWLTWYPLTTLNASVDGHFHPPKLPSTYFSTFDCIYSKFFLASPNSKSSFLPLNLCRESMSYFVTKIQKQLPQPHLY